MNNTCLHIALYPQGTAVYTCSRSAGEEDGYTNYINLYLLPSRAGNREKSVEKRTDWYRRKDSQYFEKWGDNLKLKKK